MAKHNKIGKIGEEIAAEFLKNKNYSLIKKDYKTYTGQIDIITKPPYQNKILFWRRKERPLVFVEVKTRTREKFGSPEENINYKKKQKLIKNGQSYTTFNNHDGPWRIDAICIVLKNNNTPKRINHYKNITGF
ncbi:MAG: YraN family protein [Candidatus Magasanikbacteria bacterium]